MIALRKKREEPGMCAVCGLRPGVVRISDGYVCGTCVPMNRAFADPTIKDVKEMHVKDPDILERIESFSETASYGDLRFDDAHRLFFKGRCPNRCIPVLSYSEIEGFSISFDDRKAAFNSVDGGRALLRPISPEQLKKASKEFDSVTLEIRSGRGNIKFMPYQIWSFRNRISDSKEETLRLTIELAAKLDSIIEENIMNRSGGAQRWRRISS